MLSRRDDKHTFICTFQNRRQTPGRLPSCQDKLQHPGGRISRSDLELPSIGESPPLEQQLLVRPDKQVWVSRSNPCVIYKVYWPAPAQQDKDARRDQRDPWRRLIRQVDGGFHGTGTPSLGQLLLYWVLFTPQMTALASGYYSTRTCCYY